MPLRGTVGTKGRHFAGTNFKPRKLPKNAPRSVPAARPELVEGGHVADYRPANAGSSTKRRVKRGCVGQHSVDNQH